MGFGDSFSSAYNAVAGVRQRQQQLDMAMAGDAQAMAIAERDFKMKQEAKEYERAKQMRDHLDLQRDRLAQDRDKQVDNYMKLSEAVYKAQLGLGAVAGLPAGDPQRVLAENFFKETVKSQQEVRGLASDYEERLQGIDAALARISMMAPPDGGGVEQSQGKAQDFSGENFERPMYYSPTDKPGERQAVRGVTDRMSMMQPSAASPDEEQVFPQDEGAALPEPTAEAPEQAAEQQQNPLSREQMLASRVGVSGGEYVPDPSGGPGKVVYKVYSDEEAEYAKERLDAAAKTFNFGVPLKAVVINEMKRLEEGTNKYYELVGKRDRESGKATNFKRFRAKPPSVTEINQMVATFTAFGDDEGLQNFNAVINADEEERAAIVDEIVKDYEKRARDWEEDIAMWKADRDALRKYKGLSVLDEGGASEKQTSAGASSAPPLGLKEAEFYEWYATNAEPGASKTDEEKRAKAQRARSAWVKYISGS